MHHWTSEGAANASSSGIGSVSLQGSQSIYPQADTDYEMTVHDSIGETFTCNTDVTVTKNKQVIKCIVPSDMLPDDGNKNKLVDFLHQGLVGFGSFLTTLGISNSWAQTDVVVTGGG